MLTASRLELVDVDEISSPTEVALAQGRCGDEYNAGASREGCNSKEANDSRREIRSTKGDRDAERLENA